MVEGTGPGRGTPWWRINRPLDFWRLAGTKGPEVPGRPREGRVIKVTGR